MNVKGAKHKGFDRADLSHWPLTGPRGITSTDIDRLVVADDSIRIPRLIEDGPTGRFLAVEHKRPNEPMPYGQMRALRALAAQPNWTVLVVWGTGDAPESLTVVRYGAVPDDDRHTRIRTWDELQDAVDVWFWRESDQADVD